VRGRPMLMAGNQTTSTTSSGSLLDRPIQEARCHGLQLKQFLFDDPQSNKPRRALQKHSPPTSRRARAPFYEMPSRRTALYPGFRRRPRPVEAHDAEH